MKGRLRNAADEAPATVADRDRHLHDLDTDVLAVRERLGPQRLDHASAANERRNGTDLMLCHGDTSIPVAFIRRRRQHADLPPVDEEADGRGRGRRLDARAQ